VVFEDVFVVKPIERFHYSPRECEGICFYRHWFVCLCVSLSVTTITKKIVDGFVPTFMGSFLEGKRRPSLCFVIIGRGMWKQRSKHSVKRRLFTFYTSNSRCGKCCQVLATKPPNFAFARSCTLSEYFPSSFCYFEYRLF